MHTSIIQNIKENYQSLEQSIVRQLSIKVDNHHLTAGYNREKIWLDLFRQIIPMKFAIRQGVFLIDSQGRVSKEVDIAVFDEQYTPYIFNYGNIHFIPIEAVAVVIQCKSENVSGKKNEKILTDWVKSVQEQQTSPNSIARMAVNMSITPPPTQKATTPIKILCTQKKCFTEDGEPKFGFDIVIFPELKKTDKEKKEYKLTVSFSRRIDNLYKAYHFFNCPPEEFKDFAIFKEENEKKTLSQKDEQEKKRLEALLKCYSELNNRDISKYSVSNNSILSLIFQLNQLLMLINNPMLFPHQAYVDMFNKK